MRFAFIADHTYQHPITILCRVLSISTSGYYAWRSRPASRRQQTNDKLVSRIRDVHRMSRQTYGSPRIHAELRAQGIPCGCKRVARLMRQQGIRAKQARRFVVTTNSKHAYPVAANVLDRQFEADAPNRKWLADITYIPTAEGWLYLASVLDVFSRQIVGWSMADHLETGLVADALQMALTRRNPEAGLLHHSDRGSQYASDEYQRLLAGARVQVSMSRSGNCLDNAMKESFFGTLKTECVDGPYPSRAAAKVSLFEYIEVWYNRQRRHSALGYLSPEQFERQHAMSSLSVHETG